MGYTSCDDLSGSLFAVLRKSRYCFITWPLIMNWFNVKICLAALMTLYQLISLKSIKVLLYEMTPTINYYFLVE